MTQHTVNFCTFLCVTEKDVFVPFGGMSVEAVKTIQLVSGTCL